MSNFVSLAASTLITLILPKFLGVTEYAYYQLYIFYIGYLGFFTFGWTEGVYLRYGGKYYDKLNKDLLSAQFRLFSVFESIISVSIILIALISMISVQKKIVFYAVAIGIIVYLPRAFLHNILQTTGRIKEYAIAVIVEKSIHILGTIIGVVTKSNFFAFYIISELFGRFVAMLYITFICRDIIKTKPHINKNVFSEIRSNISCGLVMMISNITSMLIIGFVRQIIEWRWDVETFGKISLTLSLSNLIMVFINSLALVVFPQLKRVNEDNLQRYYSLMRTVLMIPILAILIFFKPFRDLLVIWLPKYQDGLRYMAILFPICIFDCKMSLLITTYLKVLRKEKTLLAINSGSLLVSSCLALTMCYLLNSLDWAVFSIFFVMMLRSVTSECILKKYISIDITKNILIEMILSFVFIGVNWYFNSYYGIITYLIIYFVYIYFNRNDILKAKQTLLK